MSKLDLSLVMIAITATFSAAPALAAGAGPFEQPSPLPFHAPQFDKIKDADYLPAIEEGMRQQAAEIANIVRVRSAPTFDNTFVPMERSGRVLDRATSAFFGVSQANTNDVLQKTREDIAPKLAAHQDAIYLNAPLFARVKSVYDRRETSGLNAEQMQLVTVTYDAFVHAGANLSPADAVKLKAINNELATLSTAFEQKLLAAAKAGALSITDRTKLAGLDEAEIAAMKVEGQDAWSISLQNTTQQPLLQSMTDRATRQALFEKSWTRAEQSDANDTRKTITAIARLRADKARLLGYPNYAAYVLEDQMAETPAAVDAFMAKLVAPTRAKAAVESADIQAVIDAEGLGFKLQPWDWQLYAEKVRKARYDLSADETKPYLEYDRVLEKGVFFAATQLYGVTFKRRTDLPVYQEDVRVYDVIDADGSQLGLMYFDPFKRDNKSGGAWMGNFVGQSKLLGTKPVIYNVTNFTKPAPGQPALISFDDVTTLFHEFGHALHGLFADQTYPTLSGTNVARDYVEFPSQFNEHWSLEPSVLKNYALHYQTGAPMPQALVDKIKRATTFNQGYELGELVSAASLDLQWHNMAAGAPGAAQAELDVDAFETAALKRAGVDFPNVPPRYRSSYFLHIWSNGYAAGYYAYLWTQMLDQDAYRWFEENGGMTRANGDRFRRMILSKGHTEDYGPMYRAFRGKDPDILPMLQARGMAPR
jgi:peptidyl-dipeptidase Dcp